MPFYRWSANDMPIRFGSRRALQDQVERLISEKALLMEECNDLAAHVVDLRHKRSYDLAAFRDVCAREEALITRIRQLRAACADADERAAALGRNGRLGTKAIRRIMD